MKNDERELLGRFYRAGGGPDGGVFLRNLGAQMGMNPKRVAYLAEKWSRKGLYEYGVSVDLGWLTDEGNKVAAELR